ncbi:ThiF family adenylyltransferase, partial [Corynebacterium stationis]|uniref:ThiF family adenylyltransferase n=1 Tax=Corynebacterium stationis TaxID=1705 RepID=UPI0026192996
MTEFSPQEISRYRRQLSLAGFGKDAQAKLRDSHVAVIGAGGLGSPALLYLAGAGVGKITIFDSDTVDVSNLHRQVIHTTDKIGVNKAESARQQMVALNPEITVEVVSQRLDENNILGHLRGADVVLDGTDNFATRYNASWACAILGIPHVWASILGFDAQLTVFYADNGPIYEDLFPIPPAPGSVPSCSQAGVLGPTVGIVGSSMALEAMKLITGVG